MRKISSVPLPDPDRALLEDGTAASMRPVVRSYLGGMIAYILVNALFYRVPGDPGWIPAQAWATVVATLILFVYTRSARTMRPLEIAVQAANLMLFANSFLDIATQYQPLKLIYLVLLMPIFAFSAVRARAMVPGSVISLVTYGVFAHAHTGAEFGNYMWLAFAAAATAIGMTGAMRAGVERAVRARIAADRHRDEARQLADFDALTSLPNRRNFFAALDDLAKAGAAFDLGLIDLDGFKPVNDIYGHAAGDAVLVEVARRLTAAGDGRVRAARLGGDEFALIVEGGADAVTLLALGDRLCAELRRPYAFAGMTIGLSASIGFARGGEGLDAKPLLERADYALYRAKENQRGGAVMFDARHEQEMLDFNRIDQALRTGNLEAELHVVFQPQVDLHSGKTTGFEALARWNSPILGAVRPDVFIRAAERSGLIGELTPTLLKKALAVAAEWPEALRVAFNLSVYDLHSARAIDAVCDIVRKSGIAPSRIEFEITETAMLSDLDQALESLAKLKAMGSRIALDDFGSGFSSFGQIHRLPLDCLKIDRSFVQELLKNGKTRKIVKTMIDLCANLNLEHVVEGVETEEQLWQLREVNARCVQGYLFAQPMAAGDIADYLEREAKVTRLFQRNRG